MEYQEAVRIFEKYVKQTEFPGRPKELYEPIKYTLAMGGKRIRPALMLMAASLFSHEHQNMLDTALGLEMFHNFTLVHDDIMDNAPLRRGQKTVHEKWNRDVAILSGDVMFVRASQLISNCPAEHLKEVLSLFHSTAILVCEGQQMDMNFEVEKNVSIAEYMEMIEKKTAVLIGCSLKMGAILAGADEEDAERSYNFGKNIGIAFQLQDDVLDAFADDGNFGKRIGGDIISGKKTFLLLKAMELADEKTIMEISKTLLAADEKEKVERMLEIFKELNIRQIAEQKMKEYFDQGMKYLHEIKVPENKKLNLQQLALSLMHRNT